MRGDGETHSSKCKMHFQFCNYHSAFAMFAFRFFGTCALPQKSVRGRTRLYPKAATYTSTRAISLEATMQDAVNDAAARASATFDLDYVVVIQSLQQFAENHATSVSILKSPRHFTLSK